MGAGISDRVEGGGAENGGKNIMIINIRSDPYEISFHFYKPLFFLWTGGVAVKAGGVVRFYENRKCVVFSQKLAKELNLNALNHLFPDTVFRDKHSHFP